MRLLNKRFLGKVFAWALTAAVATTTALSGFSPLDKVTEKVTGKESEKDAARGRGHMTAPSCYMISFMGSALNIFPVTDRITMFAAIVAAKMIGTLLPMGAAAIKKDPALLSQPMLTTIMDATILVIYFGVALAFIGIASFVISRVVKQYDS